jgi:hypothetical protein
MSGSLSTNGGVNVTICGGGGLSIEVDSNSSTAISVKGSGTVDLRHAGPPDTGNCLTGNGADLGVVGAQTTDPFGSNYLPGTNGKYLAPDSYQKDPLAGVGAPSIPTIGGAAGGGTLNGTQTNLAAGATGTAGGPADSVTCPSSAGSHGCRVFTPGLYPTGITIGSSNQTTALFRPGIYYLQGSGGFTCTSGCSMQMVSGIVDGTCTYCSGTGWDGSSATTGGMLVYNTGTGQFDITANGSVTLIGAPVGAGTGCTVTPCTDYKGILFFEDRGAAANNSLPANKNAHQLGGNGTLSLSGTIYLNSTTMTASNYQELDLQGTSGNATTIQGEIIVGALSLGGNGGITMDLNNSAAFRTDKVALIN